MLIFIFSRISRQIGTFIMAYLTYIYNIFLLFSLANCDGVGDIMNMMTDIDLYPGLEQLITELIVNMLGDIQCLALINDPIHQPVFGNYFFSHVTNVQIYKILILESEDLMSPNYNTLSTIRQMQRDKCHLYVILIANGDQVARLLRFGDRTRELDTRAYFIVLHDNRLFSPDLHYLWKKLINVVFVRRFQPKLGTKPWYELSTVPFPAPIRDVMVPRRLDTWRAGKFYTGAELFRDKTLDLRRQELKVATFQHVPGSFKVPAPPTVPDITLQGEDPIGYAGIEIEILDTFSRSMNFEVDVYEVTNAQEERWGQVLLNGSYSGLLGEITSGRADLILGDLYYTPYYLKLMDLTIPYDTHCLTFLTPEALTDNSWQTLVLPFRSNMWLGLFISILIGGVVFFALAKFHKTVEEQHFLSLNTETKDMPPAMIFIRQRRQIEAQVLYTENDLDAEEPSLEGLYLFENIINSYLYTYSMMMYVSLPKFPTGWAIRILTGWWWIFCILVVVAYRASMTAILANPMPRVTIDTLDQLAESSIGVGGWGEQIKEFFQTSLDSAGQKIGSRFEVVNNAEEAVEQVAKGVFAYYENIYFLRHASVRSQIKSNERKLRQFLLGKNKNTSHEDEITRNLHIMKDCVINMPISLGLQKNSPLKPRMDRFLRQVIEAGLIKKWLKDTMADVLAADRTETTDGVKALMNVKKMFAALAALLIGYLASFLLFICEVLYWKCVVEKNPNFNRYSNTIVVGAKKIKNKDVNLLKSFLK